MKQLLDFRLVRNSRLSPTCSLLVMKPAEDSAPLPECAAGQFVQVQTDTPGVLLRRPISINRVLPSERELWLLVRNAGRATDHLTCASVGDTFNLLLPLGNGFPMSQAGERALLAGGGVGVAPLLQLGIDLKRAGTGVEFLLAARSADEILEHDIFAAVAPVHISTDDGSAGTPGLVTANPALTDMAWDVIYCCGPAPMMKGVAAIARRRGVRCYVSLENMMACGMGACLCCVENTVRGNVCVCTEGPVFDIMDLNWE